jgi:hypothetical protein
MPIGLALAGLGAASSLFGASKAAKAEQEKLDFQKQIADRLAQVSFDPSNVTGAGGAGVSFGAGGDASFDLGGFQGQFDQLGAASGFGLGAGTQNIDTSGLAFNEQLANQLGTGAFGTAQGLQQGGFQQGLQDSLFGGAQTFAGEAAQGFEGLRADTLANLRSQAQPFEERQFSNLQENLFGTGRLGTTGGGIQTEAFARGLGQADLQRQLAATGEARATRGQAIQGAQGLSGAGAGIAGLGDNLLNSAFSRFGQTAGLGAGLNEQQFGRTSNLFQRGLQGLGGQQSLQQMLLGFGQFGANLGAQRASTDISAAGGQANIANNLSGGSNDVVGSFLSGIGGGLAPAGGLGDFLSGLGGGGGKPTLTADAIAATNAGVS